ncbi:MAG TPA: RraA family protein [Burkholderiaceae bacterium]|nr:RraA family protein [Burkholderiaceae bacterium]
MDFAAIRRRLLELDTACLCDTDKQLRVMDGAIRPLSLGLKLVGRAHTVVCEDDFLTVIKALHDAHAGDVLVVATGGSRRAVAGELFSKEAQRKGLAGLVVDGAVRDVAKIRTFGIPVYSRSIIPASGTTRRIFATQVPVECGGITVHPGDVLFGDDDGIVVASEAQIAGLIDAAEAIQRIEADVVARMERGESLLAMLNFDEHYRAIEAGRASKLGFG